MARTFEKLMEERGLSDVGLAAEMERRKCPVHIQSVWGWRVGRSMPSLRPAAVLCTLFGIDVHALLAACEASAARRVDAASSN